MSVQEMKPIKEGKVREIYDNGDTLIMVATDRISCFDVILDNTVTKKGTVLTQMSKFWFDMTEDVIPNHMVSADVKDMPEFFRQPKFDGNSMMCKKLNMLPIECIVRGYITGSGWESYKKNVVNRLPHSSHTRRRRMELLSSAGLESITLVFSWLQNGHFIGILLLKTTCYLYGYYKRISS